MSDVANTVAQTATTNKTIERIWSLYILSACGHFLILFLLLGNVKRNTELVNYFLMSDECCIRFRIGIFQQQARINFSRFSRNSEAFAS